MNTKNYPESQDIFKLAKKSVNRRVIENLFPGGEWKGKEYWCRNPLREDKTPGSFSIRDDGVWHDFATNDSGDIITLVARSYGIKPFDAAKKILSTAGVPIPGQEKKGPSHVA